jgi:archaellum component FlaG (FlaF/FlaG flagellin family)
MKIKTKFQKGVTIVELLMAITASLIVILATGIIIIFGQTSWNQTWRRVNLQRSAAYAMQWMSQSIQRSVSASAPDVNVLSLSTTDGNDIVFTYIEDTNDLQIQIGARTPQVIVDGTIENLQFGVVGNAVTIDLILEDEDVQTRLVSTVMMRNYGG